MVDKTSRALRRHHHARVFQRTFKRLLSWEYESSPDIEAVADRARLRCNNFTTCSCPMCRNHRHNPWAKSDRLTMQERKENSRFEYEMKEVDILEDVSDNTNEPISQDCQNDSAQNSPKD